MSEKLNKMSLHNAFERKFNVAVQVQLTRSPSTWYRSLIACFGTQCQVLLTYAMGGEGKGGYITLCLNQFRHFHLGFHLL